MGEETEIEIVIELREKGKGIEIEIEIGTVGDKEKKVCIESFVKLHLSLCCKEYRSLLSSRL